jgi:hypothetical protein
MRVVAEARHELLDVRVDVGVAAHVVRPALQLLLRRQLALEQQVRSLEEPGLLGDLLDRIAAIPQDADVAVDVRDRAPARRRVQKRGVVRQEAFPVGAHDLPQVCRVDRAVRDRQRVLGAGAVVDDGETFSTHGGLLGR